MKTLFFPGCTLKNEAKDFERSAIASMDALGFPLVEIERWNCCGTLYSTTEDDLMHQLAPIRNLIRVQEGGADRMVTVCAMCYNTQKRANLRVKRNPDELEKINAFMNLEEDYRGGVDVVHLLEILRDEIGFPSITERVKRPLNGLKVASYYGCMLLRPREAAIDPPQQPRVLEDLSIALGAPGNRFQVVEALSRNALISFEEPREGFQCRPRFFQSLRAKHDRAAVVSPQQEEPESLPTVGGDQVGHDTREHHLEAGEKQDGSQYDGLDMGVALFGEEEEVQEAQAYRHPQEEGDRAEQGEYLQRPVLGVGA
jgi:hypothetical protein